MRCFGDHGLYSKFVPYEASVRVPLIVAGPGVPEGRVSDALVELIDVNPTICELAGLPPQGGLDARSFVPVLRGEAAEHRAETVSVIENFRCVRTREYKLIQNYNDVFELYDLVKDPSERNNVADERPETFQELYGALRERFFGSRHASTRMKVRL